MIKSIRSLLLLLSFTTLFLTACNLSLAADVTPPPGKQSSATIQAPVETVAPAAYPLVPPDPKKGETTFQDKCAPCHGVEGLGDGSKAIDLPKSVTPIGSAQTARQAKPIDWFRIVSQGNLERFMPPFPSLTDRQRWDVIAYTYSLSSSPDSIAEGAELFEIYCSECHGKDGRGNVAQAESLETKPPDFSDQKFMANKSAADFYQVVYDGVSASMPPFGEVLSENELWAITEFLRSLSFASATAAASDQDSPAAQETASNAAQDMVVQEEAPPVQSGEGTSEGETSLLGTVTGTVIHGSGGELPPGLEVMLHGYDHVDLALTATTKTGNDGDFAFEEVEMPLGRMFFTTVDYEGTRFGSELVIVENEGGSIEAPVQIFNTTSDTSGLVVDRLHFFFEPHDDQIMSVVELHIISNPTNLAVIAPSPGQAVTTFNLPESAANLSFEDGALGERYIKTDSGFGDTIPVFPGAGDYQVIFSYDLPYQGRLDYAVPVDKTTEAVVVLVPEDSIKVKGDKIQDAGIRDVQGTPFHLYNGGSFASGELLSMTIGDQAIGNYIIPQLGNNSGLLIGVGILGIVLVAAGVLVYRRYQPESTRDLESSASESHETTEVQQDPETIMDAILALDDLYKEGQLPEEAYLERRAELKTQLKTLLDNQGKSAG